MESGRRTTHFWPALRDLAAFIAAATADPLEPPGDYHHGINIHTEHTNILCHQQPRGIEDMYHLPSNTFPAKHVIDYVCSTSSIMWCL